MLNRRLRLRARGRRVAAALIVLTGALLTVPLRASAVMSTSQPMTLLSSQNPSTVGVPVTFTLSTPPDFSHPWPTGTVTFYDGPNVIGTGTLDANGDATLTTSNLTAGTHTITAVYPGDSNWSGNGGQIRGQVVEPAPTSTEVDLYGSTNPSVPNQTVYFQADSFTGPGQPNATGTVSFLDGGTVIGSATLDRWGRAFFSTASLGAGTHAITATYAGNGTAPPGSSNAIDQSVAPAGPNQRFVDQLYNDAFSRQPDAGAAWWVGQLDRGLVTRTQVALAFTLSTEYLTNETENAYWKWLGRPADPSGLQYWVGVLRSGGSLEQLDAFFLGSNENWNQVGTSDGFIFQLYDQVFGRTVDPAGRLYWNDQFIQAGATAHSMAVALLTSNEAMSDRVTAYYWLYLGRPPDASGLAYWTSRLQGGTRDEALIGYLIGSDEYWTFTQSY